MLLAELIREQVLNRTREEVPHSVEVTIEEVGAARGRACYMVTAEIWAESESQKGILIGRGRKVREIGTAARRELERELGGRVHLDLTVRVRRRWRRDEGAARPARHRLSTKTLNSGDGSCPLRSR